MVPDLKISSSLPHHYIFSVEMSGMRSSKPGIMSIKFGPIYFHNNDVIKLRRAVIRIKDKLIKSTTEEALINADCDMPLLEAISIMFELKGHLDTTIYHFSSPEKIDNEWFHDLVKSANSNNSAKELLDAARIG